jgi:L-fuculose-phosphate aldolase
VVITCAGSELSDLDPGSLVEVCQDGAALSGARTPSSELALHLAIYDRFQAGAVIHTHPPMACALGGVLDELPVIHYTMLELGGSVRVAPYRASGTEALAAVTVDALDGRNSALMANHGAVVHGPDLDTALRRAVLLEWCCAVLWHAHGLGSPRSLTIDEQRAVRKRIEEEAG